MEFINNNLLSSDLRSQLTNKQQELLTKVENIENPFER